MRLTAKILILGLFPLVIGGAAILIVGFSFHKEALLHEAEERARIELDRHTEAIRGFFDKHVTSLTALAATRVLQDGSVPEIVDQLRLWESAFSDIESLYHIDLEGGVADSSGITFSVVDRPFFAAVKRGESVVTGPAAISERGGPSILVVLPLAVESGRRTGALAGSISISRLTEEVRRIQVGQSGFAVLMDSTGSVVSEGHADSESRASCVVEALKGTSPSPVVTVLNGEPCHIHYRRIPAMGWTLALVDKENEALDKVRGAGLVTVAMLGGTLLLTVLMELALRRLVVSPIRSLMAVQRRMAAGESSARVDGFSGDELGELAQSFNQMADALDAANFRLRENETKLARLFHFAPVSIGVVGPNRTIRFVNDGTVAMFGYGHEEMLGQSTRMLYCDDAEYERVGGLLYDGVTERGLGIAEGRLRRKDGTGFDAHISMALQVADEGSSELVVIIQDITERRLAEEALRKSRDELAALNRLTRAVTSRTTLEDACSVAITTIVEALELELAVLFIREGEELHLKACGPAPWSDPIHAAPAHRVGDCLCGLAAQEARPMYCRNIHQDTRCTWEECRRAGILSFAAMPLRLGNEIIGILGVASRSERDFEKSANFLETVADQLAISIHNTRLFEQTLSYAVELEQQIAQRMQAEEALRGNERRLSLAISATEDVVWEWDLVTWETYFSPRWYEMLGYPDQAFPMDSASWRKICHPDDFEWSSQQVLAAVRAASTQGYELEFRVRSRDGSLIWILVRGKVMERSPDGKPLLMSGTISDITKRKTAEEALEASRQLLHKVVSNAPVILNAIDRDGVVTLSDGKGLSAAGLHPGEIVGQSIFERFRSYPEIAHHVRRVLAGEELNAIAQIQDQVHEVHYSPILGADGRVEGAIFFALDVTERRLAEQKIIESEAAYRILFEQSPLSIAVNRLSGEFVDVNQRFCEKNGLPREAIIGKTPFELGTVDQDEAAILLQKVLEQGGKLDDHEVSLIDPSTGARRHCLVSVRTIQIHGESLAISMVNDITERKQEEERRQKLEEQLAEVQKMEAIGRLAGGIAHDFNNILSAIVGYSELARLELSEESKAKSFVGEVLKASERAKDLVQQILAFSRRNEEQTIPILVTPVIKEALKLLRASIPSTIEICQSIGTKDTVVLGDPTRIHQIVMNLCTNAYHAMMDHGGVLTVSTEEIGPALCSSILDSGLSPGPYFVLTVSDTGQGISPGNLEKIFDPYFTTKEKDKGTGLGLAVVRGIVEGFGGKVMVSSTPGKGSTFRVALPSVKTHVDQGEGQERPLDRGSEHILLVDDEPMLVVLGKGLLESLGYQVVAVSSSAEALRLFGERPYRFDLVITDYTMPEMTGAGLAERILKIRPDMPIILCTGHSDQFLEEDAKAFGMAEYIRKPFNLGSFSTTVRRVIDQHQLKLREDGHGERFRRRVP